MTGVTTNVDVKGSLDLATRLHPDAQNVAVIAKNSEFEQYWLQAFRDEVLQHHRQLNLIEIPAALSQPVLEQVARLPTHTIVFFHLIPKDQSQPTSGLMTLCQRSHSDFQPIAYILIALITERSADRIPISQYPVSREGAWSPAYSLAKVRTKYPVDQNSVTHPKVDWRELRRWNISEAALPPGTIVLYRQPSIWQRYEKYVIAGIALIVVQMVLIIALLWQRARKRKAEAVLRESEKRFRVMANTTPSLVWMSDKDGQVIYVNDRQLEFTGDTPNAGAKDSWTASIHPDDLQSVLAQNAKALEKRERFSKEYRLRRRDGVYRWMLDVAAPRINGDDKFAGFIGSASDITDQKMAQEALEKLGGQSHRGAGTGTHPNRPRAARRYLPETVPALARTAADVRSSRATRISEAKARMLEIQQRCSEVAGDVQALSHQLHSSKLDYLGLVAALRSFCREYSQQHKMNIEFEDENIPNPLPERHFALSVPGRPGSTQQCGEV